MNELHEYLLRRVRSPQDARDLSQDVFIRWRTADKSHVQNAAAYLYRIARGVLADFYRRASREGKVMTIDSAEVARQAESGRNAHADEEAERLWMQQQVERIVTRLPPMLAAVLVMHEKNGLSKQQIAAQLGLSVMTVSKYLVRAKRQSRAMTRNDE